ncbi:hypothetical protein VMF7928_00618 [Vibrio marisflavi CECT 7928]|uniref:Transposase n=1 Tax=Vibrio marisflavi CECT 7928 TaxID=634439 RepID=A0ABM8ZZW2_9VIBR|nr:hypothetical protein VMF7928_00618 [Vibrio marisflavi CECT 7928]
MHRVSLTVNSTSYYFVNLTNKRTSIGNRYPFNVTKLLYESFSRFLDNELVKYFVIYNYVCSKSPKYNLTKLF